jgi:hypothetical protein
MSLFFALAVLLFAGIVAFVIYKAPFVAEPYKSWALWVLLAAVVLYLAYQLLGPFPAVRSPTRHG